MAAHYRFPSRYCPQIWYLILLLCDPHDSLLAEIGSSLHTPLFCPPRAHPPSPLHDRSGLPPSAIVLLSRFPLIFGRRFSELVDVLWYRCRARRCLITVPLPDLLSHSSVCLPTNRRSFLIICYLNPWPYLWQHLLGICLLQHNGWFKAGLRTTGKLCQWEYHFWSIHHHKRVLL